MRIAVIADTHIPVSAQEIPGELVENIKDCELIILAGDILEKWVLDRFQEIAETKAVYGNMDSAEVKSSLPEKLELDVLGKKIGVTHGKGSPKGLIDRVRKMFKGKMDVIIFGHSHTPVNETIDGTLFFNPGSVTDKIFAPYRSFGILEISEEDINAQIIKLKE